MAQEELCTQREGHSRCSEWAPAASYLACTGSQMSSGGHAQSLLMLQQPSKGAAQSRLTCGPLGIAGIIPSKGPPSLAVAGSVALPG